MKVLKTPEQNKPTQRNPDAVYVGEVKCRKLPYFAYTDSACGSLLLITEEDVQWYDYDMPGSGGRGPRDAGTLFFALCGHCGSRVPLADTGGNLEHNHFGKGVQTRVQRSVPPYV